MTKKSKPKIWRRILLLIIIIVWYKLLFWSITLDSKITIQPWNNFQTFASKLSKSQQFRIKLYLFFNRKNIDLSHIDVWNYYFSWSYSPSSFIQIIQDWPKTNYSRYTVLEWRSIYDIDADLSKKWFIQAWEYISLVTDLAIISKYKSRYSFLSKAWNIASLEWFLYPDTYNIDIEKDYVDQLVYLQLDTFNKKVRSNISDQNFPLDFYKFISLASVVEKEERNPNNKPTVAWILLNRIQIWMRIDADITLCYGYKEAYESCTPSFIASKLDDTNNPYNTRWNAKFVPQPISNPSFDTINSTLNYKKTDYMYYLHDNKWNIYYGKTLQEHNQNKNNYL